MNNQQLQLFLDCTPTAVAMFDRDFRYLAVSRCGLDGYRLDATGRSASF